MNNVEKLRNYFLGKDPQLKETMADNSLRLIGIEGKHFVLRTEMLKKLIELKKQVDDKDEELQGNIDEAIEALASEVETRLDNDETLQGNIDAEARARLEGDTGLQGALQDERDARMSSDNSIAQGLGLLSEQVGDMVTELEGKADAIDFTGTDGATDGTSGLVPAPETTDVDKYLKSDGTWESVDYTDLSNKPSINGITLTGNKTSADLGLDMVILSYGNSTWQDFINAYNRNAVVYCRASSGSDPASGSQTRLAFMAYVNNAASPTEVEFQYYRSVTAKSASTQGDQVFVYKLTSANGWEVATRNTYTKIVAGTNMSSSYASGTLTLSANPQENYSTTERVIGTWIDNKPLYQKVITGTIPSTTDDGTSVNADFLIDSNCNMAFVETAWYVEGSTAPYNKNMIPRELSTYNDVEGLYVERRVYIRLLYTNNLRIYNSMYSANGETFYAIVNYTKTTD